MRNLLLSPLPPFVLKKKKKKKLLTVSHTSFELIAAAQARWLFPSSKTGMWSSRESGKNNKDLSGELIWDLSLNGKCLNPICKNLKSTLSHIVYIPGGRLTSDIAKPTSSSSGDLHIPPADVQGDVALEEKHLSEMNHQDLCLSHVFVFTTPRNRRQRIITSSRDAAQLVAAQCVPVFRKPELSRQVKRKFYIRLIIKHNNLQPLVLMDVIISSQAVCTPCLLVWCSAGLRSYTHRQKTMQVRAVYFMWLIGGRRHLEKESHYSNQFRFLFFPYSSRVSQQLLDCWAALDLRQQPLGEAQYMNEL